MCRKLKILSLRSQMSLICALYLFVFMDFLYSSIHFIFCPPKSKYVWQRECHFPRHSVPALNKSYCLQIFPVIQSNFFLSCLLEHLWTMQPHLNLSCLKTAITILSSVFFSKLNITNISPNALSRFFFPDILSSWFLRSAL